MDIKEVSSNVARLQIRADKEGIDYEAFRLYRVFYEQDKNEHGSYKPYLQTETYDPLMEGRYIRILTKMEETLEAKVKNGIRN